jgi:hypothetical protein
MNTATRSELPRFLLDLIAACPRSGEGVHVWLFKVARQLHAHRSHAEIIDLLAATVADCGRHVPVSEIENAVNSAKGCAWQPRGTSAPVPAVRKWPAVNQEQREAIIATGGGLAELWEASPVRLESNEPSTEAIVDLLFPGNPLLCCGESSRVFDTKPREDWRGKLAELPLIVPSPMSAIEGVTKEGKPSKHTLSNTGPRHFLVAEFDTGTTDEHAALLLHLAARAPLVLAVHSGGKSLHGWFYCTGQPDDRLRRFMEYAVCLGADSALWTRSQFCRIPDGTRDNGNRQAVYFLNRRPLEARQ